MEKSPAFKLNKQDAVKILKGAAIAGGGAAITYLLAIFDKIDTTPEAPLVVALASIVLNILQRWITNQQK